MITVLPGILEKTFGGVADKLQRLAGTVEQAQLDIADGVFVPEITWREPERLPEFGGEVQLDAHLMVERPEQWIKPWSHSAIFRFTFHYEATYDVRRTIKIIQEVKKEVGVAINLDTPVNTLYDILEEIDVVLIMGVVPGAQGRAFDPKAVDKVRELKQHSPKTKIGVDGGVDQLVAATLREAGASILVSGSYLFDCDDIAEGIRILQGK